MAGDSDVAGGGASLLVSGVFCGTWPITHRPSSKAIITNEIVFFTIMTPEMYLSSILPVFRSDTAENKLDSPNLREHTFKVATQDSVDIDIAVFAAN